jgi:NAD(P)-dependent dehydrogenase (short-subunit alcohol dehydrogenase family)/acyl carrier protein
VLHLAQALGESSSTSSVRLSVFTNGAHDVTGSEKLFPGKAMVLGLCHVIPQEYPGLLCKSIDLAGVNVEDWLGQNIENVDRLLNDVTSSSPEAVVAYRGGHRWALSYEPLRMPAEQRTPVRLRDHGVYVITGGLGEIGLLLAEYLVREVQAKVVLTGRGGLPPADEWERYLANHSAHDIMALRIRRVKHLKSLGAQVLVVKADSADQAQMAEVFTRTERECGPINGVIHAAGLVSGDAFMPISETDEDLCSKHFEAKVAGLCVLDGLVESRNLDFCILISSLSAVLGGLRLAAYASANAFMDAFAHCRSRTSAFPWLTINWDSWLRIEDAIHMQESGKTVTGLAMTPSEGVEAFGRIIAADPGVQVVVSTGDLPSRIDQWVKMGALRGEDEGVEREPELRHARPNLQTEYVEPTNDLERAIAGIWQDLLGVERVGVNDNFFELGGDSFTGIQVISRLKQDLHAKVSAVSLYEGPTVSMLAKLVFGAQGDVTPTFDHSQSRGEKRREEKMRRQARAKALAVSSENDKGRDASAE